MTGTSPRSPGQAWFVWDNRDDIINKREVRPYPGIPEEEAARRIAVAYLESMRTGDRIPGLGCEIVVSVQTPGDHIMDFEATAEVEVTYHLDAQGEPDDGHWDVDDGPWDAATACHPDE